MLDAIEVLYLKFIFEVYVYNLIFTVSKKQTCPREYVFVKLGERKSLEDGYFSHRK